MSIQRAQALVQHLSEDDQLRKSLALATTYDERKALIDEAGFPDVSLDDVRDLQAAVVRSDELSEEELESVAGGTSASWTLVIATTVGATIVGAATVGLIP